MAVAAVFVSYEEKLRATMTDEQKELFAKIHGLCARVSDNNGLPHLPEWF